MFTNRILAVAAWALALLVFGIMLLPIIGVVGGWRASDASADAVFTWRIWENARSWELFTRTLFVSGLVALFSCLIGLAVAHWLEAVRSHIRWVICLALLFAHLISPYIIVQSFIGLFGADGSFWHVAPYLKFNLYSNVGLILLETLWLIPLAVFISAVGGSQFPAKIEDEARIYQWGFNRRLRRYYWPKYGWSLLVSFTVIGALSFWSYEIPSMLRQNLYPIELMAAFGSFYDYRQAVTLAVVPLLLAAIVLISMVLVVGRMHKMAWNNRRTTEQRHVGCPIALVSSLAFYGALMGITPLAGLVEQIGSWNSLTENFQAFQENVWNSLRNGMLASVIVSLLSLLLAMALRLGKQSGLEKSLWLAGIFAWLIPSSIWGMGLVFILGKELQFVRKVGAELVLVEIIATLPLAIVILGALATRWSDRQSEELSHYSTPLVQRCWLFIKQFWPSVIAVQLVCFIWAIREAPASLLNVPPGGATLAVTIETLLHFEQPARVAALCLFQLALSVLVLTLYGVIQAASYVWRCRVATGREACAV